MQGWKLREGQLDLSPLSQDEFWNILKSVFSNNTKKTTSYKFAFLKAIIDNVFNCDMYLRLSFSQIFGTVSEIYWNLVFIHEVKQFVQTNKASESRIEIIIKEIACKYDIPYKTPFEYIGERAQNELNSAVCGELSKYVVGAFYGDSKGQFYEFSKSERVIKLHPDFYELLVRHKYIVEKLNYYEWIRFLEKVNVEDNSYALGSKLDESNKRLDLQGYRNLLTNKYKQTKCFYCGCDLQDKSIHVDHFIPWSYIKTDRLWNFVLSCSKCNLRKSNRIPGYDYLLKLVQRNTELNNQLKDSFVKEEFRNYNIEKLKLIYNAALNNGLERVAER